MFQELESPTCLFCVIQNCFESVTGGHPGSGYYFGLLGVTDPFIQTEKYELAMKLLSKPHLDFHIAPIKRIKRKNNHKLHALNSPGCKHEKTQSIQEIPQFLHSYTLTVGVCGWKNPACMFLMKPTDDKNDPPHEEAC